MDPVVRPRTSVFAAWFDGWRRVARAPWLVVGLTAAWLATNQAAWPPWPASGLKWILDNDTLSFGGSLGAIYTISQSEPLRLLAFGQLSDFLSVNLSVAAMLLLTGGAIDRLARSRAVGSAAFFGATGEAFVRFLRASLVLGTLTWLWIDVLVPQAIRWAPPLTDTLSWLQPQAIVFVAGLIGLVILGIVGDYARVRIVVEDRRSVLGAISAAFRFVRRRPLSVAALIVLNFVVAIAMTLAARAILTALQPAPADAASSSIGPMFSAVALTVLALAQATVRLGFIGATVSYFQSELAHAGYTARPVPTWPDSPAVEAIANLEAQARAAGSGAAVRV